MPELKFPALFESADIASGSKQLTFLNLVRAEYALLVVAAVFTLFDIRHWLFLAAYALLFVGSLIALAWRAYFRPEQGWYGARALAESVKTLTWRYAMRAEPFDDEKVIAATRDFRDHLAALLRSNRHVGESLSGIDATRPQITDSMIDLRGRSIEERKAFYLENRIQDQKGWYSHKSAANKRSAVRWQFAGAAAYLAAVVMVILQVPYADARFPVAPMIVIASAVLGWMQIKKYNELASAYALTAHEIGLAEGLILAAKSDQEFSRAVNEVELVFSREHTHWVARQAGL